MEDELRAEREAAAEKAKEFASVREKLRAEIAQVSPVLGGPGQARPYALLFPASACTIVSTGKVAAPFLGLWHKTEHRAAPPLPALHVASYAVCHVSCAERVAPRWPTTHPSSGHSATGPRRYRSRQVSAEGRSQLTEREEAMEELRRQFEAEKKAIVAGHLAEMEEVEKAVAELEDHIEVSHREHRAAREVLSETLSR